MVPRDPAQVITLGGKVLRPIIIIIIKLQKYLRLPELKKIYFFLIMCKIIFSDQLEVFKPEDKVPRKKKLFHFLK